MNIKFSNQLKPPHLIKFCIAALLGTQLSLIGAVGVNGNTKLSIVTDSRSGSTSFISGKNNVPVSLKFSAGQTVADAVASQFSKRFGIQNPAQELLDATKSSQR